MPLLDFHQMVTQEEYGFLRENEHLGKRIILLGQSGSYGYGTNREGSDVDFRGYYNHVSYKSVHLTS